MANQPSVCLASLYCEQDKPWMDRFEWMAGKHPWIQRVVVLQTDQRDASVRTYVGPNDTVIQIHRGWYGEGFAKQPSDGGLHELRARNDLMRLAEATGCDWILLADPDEYFRDETYGEIQKANRRRKDIVWFECYHYCAPSQYLWWVSTLRSIHNSYRKLHDPHPRAVRATARLRYVQNDNNRFRRGLTNHTMHCHIEPHAASVCHMTYGIYHIHTRHMYDPKRPSKERLAKFAKKHSPYTLPDRYVADYVSWPS